MSLRDIVVGVAPGVRGVKGEKGEPGRAATFNYRFSTATADADPGGGAVAFNNADPSLATEIYLDDNEAGGADISAWLDLLTATGNTDNRGELHFQATTDPERFARFQVTGTVTSDPTYRRVSVTALTVAGLFAADEVLALALYRVGPKGEDGLDGGGDVTGPASSTGGNLATFGDATGKSIADSGVAATSVVTETSLFERVDPEAAAEDTGEITCDLEDGKKLFFTRTLAGAEELQAPDNAPIGVTFYLLVDPNGETLTFAAGYEGPGDALPNPTTETLLAIVKVGASRFLVHVVGDDYGDGS
ncbi:MAG: hypothetical protein EA385_10630 [Salinarimonadaceae bacterium]|nr:MAG: hypothetical protein EA385_10630 [Salinarimonadaceae bacterium]